MLERVKLYKASMRCDGDLLIVHHKESEEKFVEDGFGLFRKEFMYNDFVLIGLILLKLVYQILL